MLTLEKKIVAQAAKVSAEMEALQKMRRAQRTLCDRQACAHVSRRRERFSPPLAATERVLEFENCDVCGHRDCRDVAP